MSSSRRSGACLRCCLVIFAVSSALCVSGPALYWRFNKGFGGDSTKDSSSLSCAPCICNCPPPLSLEKIAPGEISCSLVASSSSRSGCSAFFFFFNFYFSGTEENPSVVFEEFTSLLDFGEIYFWIS